MEELVALFGQMRWQDALDILLVSFIIYKVILMVRGTRAMHMLLGLGVVFIMLIVSRWLSLLTINWLINSFLSSLILVVIILFQAEIRRGLARIGRKALFAPGADPGSTLEEVVRAAEAMAQRFTGALIALERRIGLGEYVDKGVRLDAAVSRELLVSLFQTSGPLHDGAVIISGDRIEAAKVVLPLSNATIPGPQVGTRHRAALGLAEETDAVCVVVSEERGEISLAVGNRLIRRLDPPSLRNLLLELFEVGRSRHRRFLVRG